MEPMTKTAAMTTKKSGDSNKKEEDKGRSEVGHLTPTNYSNLSIKDDGVGPMSMPINHNYCTERSLSSNNCSS